MAITYEVRGGIAYIAFCRPEKHNALRDEDVRDLADAVARLDGDDSANIGIIHGGPGPSFSSGADIADRLKRSVDDQSAAGRANEMDSFLQCENWKPLIAAIHGYCLGHALWTALLCDHLIATCDAKFQVTEIVIGLPTIGLSSYLPGRPMFVNDVAMTGRFFTADEAWEAGMLTRLVNDGEHVTSAEDLARQILANPQAAVREVVRVRRTMVAENLLSVRNVLGTLNSGGERRIEGSN